MGLLKLSLLDGKMDTLVHQNQVWVLSCRATELHKGAAVCVCVCVCVRACACVSYDELRAAQVSIASVVSGISLF